MKYTLGSTVNASCFKNIKMKKLLFIFFAGFSACSPEEVFIIPPGSIKEVHVIQERSKIESYHYYYYNQKSQLVKIVFQSDNEDVAYTTYEYDKFDHLKRKMTKYTDGAYWTDYTYDAEGRVIKETGSDGVWELVYDDEDRLIRRIPNRWGTNSKSGYEFKYDSLNPNNISEELYWDSGYMEEHLKYQYNMQGQLIAKKVIDGPRFYLGTKEYYVYDSQGRLSSELFYNLQGPYIGLEVTKRYLYNE